MQAMIQMTKADIAELVGRWRDCCATGRMVTSKSLLALEESKR